MNKKSSKSSRKLKEKKLAITRTERKKRKKLKDNTTTQKNRTITPLLVLKTNLLPVSVFMLGCLIFYFSTGVSFSSPVYFDDHKIAKEAFAKEVSLLATTTDSIEKVKYSINMKKPKAFEGSELGNSFTKKDPVVRDFAIPISDKNIWEKIRPEELDYVSGVINPDDTLNEPEPIEKKPIAESIEIKSESTLQKEDEIRLLINYSENFTYENVKDFKTAVSRLVINTPMEAMVDDIVKRDRAVAAFLLGIGMKESKYGIYSPKKDGAECFNYWGYRGKENQTKSGYSCFDSPAHAVQVVGNRIETLVKGGLDTPAKMIVWKCGSSCAGHSPESVDKWIADVSINYYRLNPVRLLTKK
jgi:hypothetical protein